MRGRLRPDDEHVGDRRVADPGLRAVQAVAARDLFGPRFHAAGVGARVRLGQAEAADELATRQARQVFLPLRRVAIGVDRIHDERALHAHHRAVAGIDALDLARDQPVGDVAGVGAAEFLRQGHAEQPRLAHQAKERRIGLFLEIGLLDSRPQLLGREFARRVADHPLVLGELALEQQRIVPLERTEARAVISGHGVVLSFAPFGRTHPIYIEGLRERRGPLGGAGGGKRGARSLSSQDRRIRKRNAERSAFARPVGDDRAARAADLALERPDQGRRRDCRLRLYRTVGGAETRGSRRQGRRARGGRDRLRRRGAQCRSRQRRHVGDAARVPEGARPRLWRTRPRPCSATRPRSSGRRSRNTRSTAIPCATARCIARSARRGLPRSRSARGSGASAARRSGCCPPRRPPSASAPTAYAGSLLDMRAGTIQPLAYARGLARAAIAAGAAIHTQSPVRAAERTGGAWTLTTGGRNGRRRLDRGGDRRLWRRALAAGTPRADPPALFQFRHRAARAELQASILPGREGCWDTRTIMSYFRFDRARAARVRQRRARCAEPALPSIAPGRSGRSQSSFRASATSNSSLSGTA